MLLRWADNIEGLGAFLLAAFALTGSPGPNTLSVAAVGAGFGRLRGLPYMLGLSFGVGLVALITGSGVSAAVLALPGVAPAITVLAGLYFLYLAIKIATAPPLTTQTEHTTSSAPPWYAGVFVSLANPKAYAAMGALFSGYTLIENNPLLDGVWKLGWIMAVILVVNLAWLSVGAMLSGLMRQPRASRMINIGFAVLLVISVAALAFAR